ncbi:MAG: hypothetical protein U0587_07455 [Candidatus Binatia bacterium]
MPSIAAQEMPRALAERFGVQAGDGLVRLLRFLSPSELRLLRAGGRRF